MAKNRRGFIFLPIALLLGIVAATNTLLSREELSGKIPFIFQRLALRRRARWALRLQSRNLPKRHLYHCSERGKELFLWFDRIEKAGKEPDETLVVAASKQQSKSMIIVQWDSFLAGKERLSLHGSKEDALEKLIPQLIGKMKARMKRARKNGSRLPKISYESMQELLPNSIRDDELSKRQIRSAYHNLREALKRIH